MSARAESASPVAGDRLQAAPPGTEGIAEVVVFRVGDLACGLDIRLIREIKKLGGVTRVHRAPPHVFGVLNLRGQIVTLIDLRAVFSLGAAGPRNGQYVMVVSDGAETIGMLVDSVENSISIDPGSVHASPANVKGAQGRYFLGIHEVNGRLLPLLDPRKVLYPEAP